MIGFANRLVINDDLTLNAGQSKEYVFTDIKNIGIYGYAHNLVDGIVSVMLKYNDTDSNSVCLVSSDSYCIVPVTEVNSESGIKVIVTANQDLSSVSFSMVIYYCFK